LFIASDLLDKLKYVDEKESYSQQGCGVGGKMFDSDLSKISDSDLSKISDSDTGSWLLNTVVPNWGLLFAMLRGAAG